jgi:hypothetical protein
LGIVLKLDGGNIRKRIVVNILRAFRASQLRCEQAEAYKPKNAQWLRHRDFQRKSRLESDSVHKKFEGLMVSSA